MPFKSKKQEVYLRLNEPEVYQDWKNKYGSFKEAEEFAAYVSTDTTRRVRGELKRAFPNMKFSVSKKDGTLRVAIMQGDLDFRDLWEDVPYDKQYWRRWNDPKPHFDGYVDINTYHTDSYNPKYTSVFNEVVDIMKGDEWFDNSDAQIDYFNTAYYLSLTIGKRDRDYIYTGVPRMSDLFRGETFEPTYEERMDVSYYFTFEPKQEGGGQTLYRTLEDAQKAVAKMEKPLEIFEYRNMDDVGAKEREKQKQDHLEWSEREKTGEFFEDFWWKDEMSRYRNSKDPYLHHSTNESSPEMDEADGFYEEHILADNPTRSKIRENESYAEILGISERLSNLLNSSRTFGMYITQRTHPKTVEKYRQIIIDGFDNYTPQSDKERTIMKIVRNNVATRGLRGPQPSYYSTSMGILRKPELSYTYSDYYSDPVPFMGYELTDEENKIIGETKNAESETFEARDCVDIVSNFVEPSRNYYRVRFRNPKIFVGGKYTTPQWGQRAAMTIGKKYYGVSGCKITMAQPMGGRWVIQNVLIPKQGGVEMDEELALKIANHIQDRIEREGKWASVICRDRGSTRYVSRINNQHIVRDERGRFAPHAAEDFGAESERMDMENLLSDATIVSSFEVVDGIIPSLHLRGRWEYENRLQNGKWTLYRITYPTQGYFTGEDTPTIYYALYDYPETLPQERDWWGDSWYDLNPHDYTRERVSIGGVTFRVKPPHQLGATIQHGDLGYPKIVALRIIDHTPILFNGWFDSDYHPTSFNYRLEYGFSSRAIQPAKIPEKIGDVVDMESGENILLKFKEDVELRGGEGTLQTYNRGWDGRDIQPTVVMTLFVNFPYFPEYRINLVRWPVLVDVKTNESYGAEGYIDDGLIWEMRDRLEPPAQGYVMFASSSPEVNIPYLLDKGYDRDEIIIVEYGGNETIWIPNTLPLKRAEEFGADGR